MKFLRKLRDLTGKSAYQLAKDFEMNRSTIYDFEKKNDFKVIRYIANIQKSFNISWEAIGKLIDEEVHNNKKKKTTKGKK